MNTELGDPSGHDKPTSAAGESDSTNAVRRSSVVDEANAGKRLDQAAANMFPDFSRGQLQKWIKSGELQLDGKSTRPRSTVRLGQAISVDAVLQNSQEWPAQAIALDIVFEDEQVLVINKEAGIVVHPAAGNKDGTLANAVLAHCPANQTLARAGIVHRLDKDTSGLMVVAKSSAAHNALVAQLQARTVHRQYLAIACGPMIAGGVIDKPIGRHPTQRIKMAVRPSSDANAKPAVTHYRIKRKFLSHTELSVKLETGRTHQIRVHMAELGHPLLGDPVYLGNYRRPAGISDAQNAALMGFKRQALHATRLEFTHPTTLETVRFDADPPRDYRQILTLLEQMQS